MLCINEERLNEVFHDLEHLKRDVAMLMLRIEKIRRSSIMIIENQDCTARTEQMKESLSKGISKETGG